MDQKFVMAWSFRSTDHEARRICTILTRASVELAAVAINPREIKQVRMRIEFLFHEMHSRCIVLHGSSTPAY